MYCFCQSCLENDIGMKITFVYPGIGICGFKGSDYPKDGEYAWISHGIASVATAISSQADVELIDLRDFNDWDEFSGWLIGSDYFALSISSLNKKPALKAIELIREKSPQSEIIVGGFDPSMYPNNYVGIADHVIVGDGEYKLAESLGFELNGKLPWINRELFDYNKELNFPFTPNMKPPMVTMIAGRGCPYNCSYCQPAERVVHGHYRIREVDDVLGELRYLKDKYNYNSVLFWDDTFAINPKWVDKFCDGFKELGAQLVINCRADIISDNPNMMERLKDAGLLMVLVGVESGSPRMLKLIRKEVKISQTRRAFELCKKLGIQTFATFMLGLPTETRQESISTMTFINTLEPTYGLVFYYTPIPGTDLYDFCDANDLIIDKSRSIERTGKFTKNIKGIDYQVLDTYIDSIKNSPHYVT